MLVVVGPGRCGTKTFAANAAAMSWSSVVRHEPSKFPLVPQSALYAHGELTVGQVAWMLQSVEWAQVHVDHRLILILDLLVEALPNAKFLYLRRNFEDNVASLVRRDWFLPSDDQVGQFIYWENGLWEMNYPGFRPNPTRMDPSWNHTGDDVSSWDSWGQEARCAAEAAYQFSYARYLEAVHDLLFDEDIYAD